MLASRRAFAAGPGRRSIASVLRYSTEAAAPAPAPTPPTFKAAVPPVTSPAAPKPPSKLPLKPTTTFRPAYVAKKVLTTPPNPAAATPASRASEILSSPADLKASSRPASEASTGPAPAAVPRSKPAFADKKPLLMPSYLHWDPKPPPVAPKTQEPPHDINWGTSFYGLGTNPVTPEQFEILLQRTKVEDIEVKPDGIIYLPEIKYRRRLNEAFGPMGWGIVPRGDAVVGKEIVTREFALIVNGCFVSQAQGVNNYFSAEGIPQAVEGAKSNALMRCCKDLGIASELWDPVFLRWFNKHHAVSQWVEHTVTKKKRRWHFRKDAPMEVPYPYKLA